MPFTRAYIWLNHWAVDIDVTFESQIFLSLANERPLRSSRVSLMSELCNQLSPLPSHVTWLEIRGNSKVEWRNYTVSTEWLELFHPFTAVQSLRVVGSLERFVVAVLQDLTGERTTDVSPALRNLSLGIFGSSRAEKNALVTARRLLGHP